MTSFVEKAASQRYPCTEQVLAPANPSHLLSLSLSVARQAGGLEAGRPHRGVHGDVDVSSLLPIKVRVCVQVCPSSPKFKGGPSKGLSRLPPLIPIPCLPSLHDAMCDDEGDDVGWLMDERRDDVRGGDRGSGLYYRRCTAALLLLPSAAAAWEGALLQKRGVKGAGPGPRAPR